MASESSCRHWGCFVAWNRKNVQAEVADFKHLKGCHGEGGVVITSSSSNG